MGGAFLAVAVNAYLLLLVIEKMISIDTIYLWHTITTKSLYALSRLKYTSFTNFVIISQGTKLYNYASTKSTKKSETYNYTAIRA